MPLGQKGIAHLFLILLVLTGVAIGIYLVQNPQIFSPKADESRLNVVAVHKFYNPKLNAWFWADNQNEINQLLTAGYEDRGVPFFAFTDGNTPGTVPLYRLYKQVSEFVVLKGQNSDSQIFKGFVFFTTSKAEADLLENEGNIPGMRPIPNPWKIKDAALYVYPPNGAPTGAVPVYRLVYSEPQYQPDHIYYVSYYLSSQREINDLMATGKYINQGIAFYGAPPPAGFSPVPLAPTAQEAAPATTSTPIPTTTTTNPQDNTPNRFGINITLQRNICSNGLPNLEFSWNGISGADTYYILRTLPGKPEESLAHTVTAAFGDTPEAQNGLVKYTVKAGVGNNLIAGGEISIQTKNCAGN
jgi:hypothetical protein